MVVKIVELITYFSWYHAFGRWIYPALHSIATGCRYLHVTKSSHLGGAHHTFLGKVAHWSGIPGRTRGRKTAFKVSTSHDDMIKWFSLHNISFIMLPFVQDIYIKLSVFPFRFNCAAPVSQHQKTPSMSLKVALTHHLSSVIPDMF